jgi:hypothetical protein
LRYSSCNTTVIDLRVWPPMSAGYLGGDLSP